MRYVKELRYNFNAALPGYNLATHITSPEGRGDVTALVVPSTVYSKPPLPSGEGPGVGLTRALSFYPQT